MSVGEQLVWRAVAQALARPPRLTVSEWAAAHRVLPRETTRQHGPWRNDRVPYAVAIMDALSAHDRSEVVALMKGAQIAGTEIGLNALGYWIEHDPSSVLVVCPSIPDARKFSRRRLRPLILSTPALRQRVEEERSRDAASNTLYREYPGGAVILVGANAPGGLAGNPVRRLFFDDADSCAAEVGEEGDPLYLAEVRTTTFPNRKVYVNGTPKIEGESRIGRLFLRGDQRRYFVPCPRCGHQDFLTWSGYANFSDLEDGGHYRIAWEEGRPETAHLICPDCGARIEEAEKEQLFARGEWRATAAGDGRTKSFHLSGLYSPHGWLSWAELVREFLEAKNDPVALKGWVNLRLGETWRRHQDALKPQRLLARFERWEAEVPRGVGVLVAACDVQDYGLVYLVVGYGSGEESWVIEYGEFHGDPAKADVWRELDRIRETRWKTSGGREVGIDSMVVDSGGHHTHEVYEYCKARQGHRVWAIRGGNDPRSDLVSRASRKNQGGVFLWTLGVDTGKDTVHSRLKIETAGPGCIHIPQPDHEHGRWLWANAEFAAQLASEVMVRKRHPRHGWTRAWKQVRDRNEAWDCFDADTEVLARRGWICFSELEAGDEVATVNLERDRIEYQVPVHLIRKRIDGPMLHLSGRRLEILVTPTHRMIAAKKRQETIAPGVRRWNLRPPWEIVPARELTIHHTLKLTSHWEGRAPEVPRDPGDLAEFLGWYVAEGCLWSGRSRTQGNLRRRVSIAQNPGPKQERILELAARLGWPGHVSQGKAVVITRRELYELIQTWCPGGQFTRRVPQWIKDSPPAVIERFVAGAVAGDGWLDRSAKSVSRRYATISPDLADDMQELFLKLGRCANVSWRPAKVCNLTPGARTRPQYWVTECLSERAWLDGGGGGRRQFIGRTVHYRGEIFCATVPNGTLICRRHGKAFMAGNCMVYSLAALRIRGPAMLRELAARAQALASPPGESDPPSDGALPTPAPRPHGLSGPRKGWVRGW